MRAWLLALAACGRIGFDAQAIHGGDAGGDAVAACTWSPFSTPTALLGPIQSPVDDWCPAPTADALQIFFHTYRNGVNAEIWHATRASTAVAFGAASQVTELTTGTSQQFNPTVTGDGLHVIYADSMPSGTFHLYEAVRTSPTGTFGAPIVLSTVNSVGNDWNPFVSSDGLRLVLTSNHATGNDQIYETTRSNVNDAFATPTLHAELTVQSTDQWTPTLTADWLDIFFSSTRTGGPGGYDVYTAHRPSLADPFGAATLVPQLSSPLDDVCMRLAPDGKTIYMSYAAMTGGGGNADLDSATRTCQ